MTSILVVEDEAIVAAEIQSTLEALGYSVPGVGASGAEALSLAAECQPDLVLMDVCLQGEMDGIDTATEMLSRHDVPIVYLTANADDACVSRASATEPYGYLLKPFDGRELRTTIELALKRRRLERKRRDSELRYRAIVQSSSEGVWSLDPEGRTLFVNQQLADWLQASGAELVGVPMLQHVAPEDRRALEDALTACRAGSSSRLELRLVSASGRVLWMWLSLSPAVDGGGMVAMLTDVSERKRSEQALRSAVAELERRHDALLDQAIRDPLTGAYNRGQIQSLLATEVERARSTQASSALLMIDVDHFKAINDRHGHQAGDEVLKQLGKLLQQPLRGPDRVGRYGGEEFLVLLPKCTPQGSLIVAERLRAEVARHPFVVPSLRDGQTQLWVTISIGVATFPEDGASPADLVRRADEGLYAAKAQGRNRAVAVGPALRAARDHIPSS